MKTTTIAPFKMIGIAIRTTNENGQASIDIPKLWERFFSENLSAQIPDKAADDIYSVYTDYELDYTKPYTVILGYRVNSLEVVPEGFTGKSFEGGTYTKFTAKGKLADGMVYEEWTKIWNSELPRIYTADFEVYGTKSQVEQAEVDIFIAL